MSQLDLGWGLPLASGGQRPGMPSGTPQSSGRPQQSYAVPGVSGEAEERGRASCPAPDSHPEADLPLGSLSRLHEALHVTSLF